MRAFPRLKGLAGGAVLSLLFVGCGDQPPIWRDQALPSGGTVKVIAFRLAWGIEHDERLPAQDAMVLEFVASNPDADLKRREREALEAFELIRPVSEQWGFRTATLARFETMERTGSYELYVFTRRENGTWGYERTDMSAFARKTAQ